MTPESVIGILNQTWAWISEYYTLVQGKTVTDFLHAHPDLRQLEAEINHCVKQEDIGKTKDVCRQYLLRWRTILFAHTQLPHPRKKG